MAKAANPCQATARIRRTSVYSDEGARITDTESGRGVLTVGKDGAFAARIPVTWNVVTELDGCTVTPIEQEINLVLEGGYRAEDGSLVFSRIAEEGFQDALRTVECGDRPPDTVSVTGPPSTDLTSGQELAVDLADGATLGIPPPADIGEFTWDMTLELSHGGEGGVAVAWLSPGAFQ